MTAPHRPGRLRRILPWVAVVIGVTAGMDGLVIAFGDHTPGASASPTATRIEIDLKPPSTTPSFTSAEQLPTAEGATAFVRTWFDALNYSLAHGDTELLAGHTNAGCRFCTGYLLGIIKWKEQRATLAGGYTVPAALAIGPFSTTDPVTFAAVFLTSPATLRQPDGSAVDYPGGRTRGGVSVLYANGRWQMTDVVLDLAKTQETS